jgi:membrane AbrB-like protein
VKPLAHLLEFLRVPLIAVPVAAAGGALAYSIHMPLPWVLGAMLAVAAVSLLSGRSLEQAGLLRRLAQGCIGLAIGLAFTPATLALLLQLSPWIVLAAATALALSVLSAPIIQRLAKLDGPTAIYAVALGASSEMALQALRAGADGASVASAHAVRIIIVTSSVTLLAWFWGHPGGTLAPALATAVGVVTVVVPWDALSVLLLLSGAAALLMQRLDVPNPWLLGPLLVGGSGAAILGGVRMPDSILLAAQIMIGWSLGQNMTREFFVRAPRVLASAALVTVGILVVCLAMGAFISWGAGLPVMTAFLALAPGGMAEMGVIAKAFGLGAPVVAAFHIVRVICTIFLTGALARWMLRSAWVRP